MLLVTVSITLLVTFLVMAFVVDPYFLNADRTLYNDAQRLQVEGNYEAALLKYQNLKDNFPNSYYTLLSFNSSLDCHYAYISSLIADKNYDEAQQQYTLLFSEYSSTRVTPEKDSVLKDIPADILFDWAKKLQNQNDDSIALRVYDVIVKYHFNSQYASEADTTIVDMEMTNISQEGSTAGLSSPYEISSQQVNGKAQIVVINDSPDPLTVFLKGPVTKRVIIDGSPNSTIHLPSDLLGIIRSRESANRATITLEPGTYEMAVRTNSSIGVYGETTFSSDTRYEYCYYYSF